MIDGSTFVVMVTCGPVRSRGAAAVAETRSGDSGAAVVTSACSTCPMLHQPFAVDVEEIRQQRQPAPRGEQQHELADRRRRLQALEELLHDGALVSGRHDRIRERSLQIGVTLRTRSTNAASSCLGALGIRFFDGDVEQRSSRSALRRPACSCCLSDCTDELVPQRHKRLFIPRKARPFCRQMRPGEASAAAEVMHLVNPVQFVFRPEIDLDSPARCPA